MKEKIKISDIKTSIENILKYFGIFRYPLKYTEIHRFLSLKCDINQVQEQLDVMVRNKEVFLSEQGFYSLADDYSWTENRLNGYDRAIDLLNRAHKYIKRIIRFPFVYSVAISGSLSKYYSDKEGDIDYFIITHKNRLWIARTLLHFYKKFTFFSGNEHYYCMNYFIDETALEIDQKNIYSAIETVTLIPVYNEDVIIELKKQNSFWIEEFLPNEQYEEDLKYVQKLNALWIKKIIEKAINLLGANGINLWLMKVTDRKWRKKWQNKLYPMERYNEAFFTSINISKNHPANFQAQILNAFDKDEPVALTKNFEECQM